MRPLVVRTAGDAASGHAACSTMCAAMRAWSGLQLGDANVQLLPPNAYLAAY
jgi:hypothetical protein